VLVGGRLRNVWGIGDDVITFKVLCFVCFALLFSEHTVELGFVRLLAVLTHCLVLGRSGGCRWIGLVREWATSGDGRYRSRAVLR
jgi:hypothetical protein